MPLLTELIITELTFDTIIENDSIDNYLRIGTEYYPIFDNPSPVHNTYKRTMRKWKRNIILDDFSKEGLQDLRKFDSPYDLPQEEKELYKEFLILNKKKKLLAQYFP